MIALSIDGENPPDKFLLFRKGENSSTKGTVIFDDVSATAVMERFKEHGADLLLDLEHLSLDDYAPNYRTDACAWFKLAVIDGALWAVDVRWTPEGIERLQNKRQRYTSPAFMTDDKGRVIEVVNCALCAMPATHQLAPLIAATRKERDMEELLKEFAAAIGLGDNATKEDVMSALSALVKRAGEQAPPAEPPPEDKPTDALSRILDVVGKLSKRIDGIETRSDAQQVDDIIRANTAKIGPALETWARKQTPVQLREFVASAPEIHAHTVKQPGHEGSDAVQLTAEDIATANRLSIPLDKFKEGKAKSNAHR